MSESDTMFNEWGPLHSTSKVSGYGYGLWYGFKWGPHHATSHHRSRLESQHQCVTGCAEEFSDPLVQSGGRWQTWVWQQDSAPAHKSKENHVWLQKECYDFVLFSHWPRSSPDLNPLDYFVWSYVENINMTSHNTKASLIAAIRRVFAGACRKGMLPVPDPYQGGDWGWRRLHWIDDSSTT